MNSMYNDAQMSEGKAIDWGAPNCDTKLIRCSDEHSVEIAATQLRRGNVIALPTDTLYGLACDANNPDAIQRLYEIKERDEEKPVAVCIPNITQLRYYSLASHLPDRLLSSLLPGGVTIILFKSRHLNNPLLNNGIPKIGLRIPDCKFIQSVSVKFDAPIALTSANRSGERSTLNVHEFEELWGKLSSVFDGGRLGDEANDMEQRSGSTVIDLSQPDFFRIIRNGSAKKHTLNVMRQYNIQENL